MSEFDDWRRKQELERATRELSSQRFEAQRRANAEQNAKISRENARAELLKNLKAPADRLERVLRNSLASDFRRVNQSMVTQEIGYLNLEYPRHNSIRVVAAWGNKLGLTQEEKNRIEQISGPQRKIPPPIIEKDCKELHFQVGYDEIKLLDLGIGVYPSQMKLENFNTDYTGIFPIIQAGLNSKGINKFEDWEFFTKGGYNSYQSRNARNEWYRFDAMDA